MTDRGLTSIESVFDGASIRRRVCAVQRKGDRTISRVFEGFFFFDFLFLKRITYIDEQGAAWKGFLQDFHFSSKVKVSTAHHPL